MRQVLLLIMLQCFVFRVVADHEEPVVQLQKNKQTDLFEQSFGGKWQQEQQNIEALKEKTVESLKTHQGLEMISDLSPEELKARSNDLSKLEVSELESKGLAKVIEEDVLNQFYVDYEKPLNKQYLEDAKDLANAQKKLLANLSARLNEFGVECQTVKGDKEQEPMYFLQIEKRPIKNSRYNQTFCEELRNRYDCRDALKLRCIKRALRFKEWQARKIRLNGPGLINEKMSWGFLEHIKGKKKWYKSAFPGLFGSNKGHFWIFLVHPHHPSAQQIAFGPYEDYSHWRGNPGAIINDARHYIASKLGVMVEQIGDNIEFNPSAQGVGPMVNVRGNWYVWSEYELGYLFRDAYEICEEFSKEWDERCRLK